MKLISTTLLTFAFYFISAQNLVVNGDFEAGNNGFSSEYIEDCNAPNDGEFCVTQPTDWTAIFAGWDPVPLNAADGIGGQILHVNGDVVAGKRVWCQTIEVQPNTSYKFSTFISSIIPQNPAQLQFSINGQTFGDLITAGTVAGDWDLFFEVWNSGSNTQAEICIVNQNTVSNGNDFVLDNIKFEQVSVAFPNLFIPNNETGLNTEFAPITFLGIDQYELKVYNRWGRLVHSSTQADNTQPTWDGSHLGGNRTCSAGTYFWILTTNFNVGGETQEQIRHGYVQLVD